jgi:hypothetical protein
MSEDPPRDRQAGVTIGDFASNSNPKVAHGDRRQTVHYEPDPDQLTRVSHTFKPMMLPPDEVTRDPPARAAPVIQDAAIVPPEPSVWDASPDDADDDHGR